MDRSNLTVLTHALVTRVIIENRRAVGVEVVVDDRARRFTADSEVVLSLGAIHTLKVLMQTGIGDEEELRRWAIPVIAHLPGVGRNFQEQVALSCIWEYKQSLVPRNNAGEATFFWKSDPSLDTPDLQTCQVEVPHGVTVEVDSAGSTGGTFPICPPIVGLGPFLDAPRP